jgi:hypothetical protein
MACPLVGIFCTFEVEFYYYKKQDFFPGFWAWPNRSHTRVKKIHETEVTDTSMQLLVDKIIIA